MLQGFRSGALLIALLSIGPFLFPAAAQGEVRDEAILSRTVRDADVRGAWIRAATVEDSTLERVAVSDSTLRRSTVTAALLAGVTLEDTTVSHAWVELAGVTGGSLTDVTVHNSTLTNVALTRVTLCNVSIPGQGTVMTGCNGATSGRPTPPGTPGTPPPPTPPTPPPSDEDTIFTPDGDTLAVFELNGNVQDSSGNGRNAGLTDAPDQFVRSRFGQGLQLGTAGPGIIWSDYAGLLRHPFTVEMVFVPDEVTGYRKLFSPDDAADPGWYNYGGSFYAYSVGPILGTGVINPNSVNYVALVSTSPTEMDVYVNGVRLGSTPMTFTAPPPEAIFFRDDRGGTEQFTGYVDAIRISAGSRSQGEIEGVLRRIGD